MAVDLNTILGLISKGVNIVQMLWEAGKDIAPAVTVLKNLIAGGQQGNLTAEELLALEEELDQQIAAFNEPLPPE